MSTFKQIDKERRLLRGIIAKLADDLIVEARATGNKRIWNLVARLEGVMAACGIERDGGTRRNP